MAVETQRPPQLSLQDRIKLLAAQYRLLIEPGQLVELRALGVQKGSGRPYIESGYFDYEHLRDMAREALRATKIAKGVYFTLNPVNPDLQARRANRIAWTGPGESTSDDDILRRRWLLVDADPVRDPKVSATDEEKAHARDTILQVREHLRGLAWPEPFLADSGNGYHLLYRVDMPTEDGGQVARILSALAAKFDSDHVKIDQAVFNPSRICKLPGTMARKGDSVPRRPHREAKLLEGPGL
jgi:hypothetical protein